MDKIIRWLIIVLASLGLLLGFIALVSPIPIGLFIIAINGAILLCVSPRAQAVLQKLRGKSTRLNGCMHNLEIKLEKRFQTLWRALSATRPLPDARSNRRK